MATKTMAELQAEEEQAKSTYEEKVETPDAGIGLALMGFGMGVTGKGGQFQQIVEQKKAAVRQKRKDLFESARRDRMELQNKQERDRDRALQQQRHNETMKVTKMKEVMGYMTKANEFLGKGNIGAAVNVTMLGNKQHGSQYYKHLKDKSGKDVILTFDGNIDSKPVMGALAAGDKQYRYNAETQYVETLNPDTGAYDRTNIKGTLADAYKPESEDATGSAFNAKFMSTFIDTKSPHSIEFGKDVDFQSIEYAKKAQGDAKMSATLETELSGKLAVYRDGKNILKYIKDEDVQFNVGETGKTAIQKVIGVDNWESVTSLLSKSDDELSGSELNKKKAAETALATRITADTKLQNMIAGYVKIISGAAVTDEERKNFYKIITGGQYSTGEALSTALGAFVESVGDDYKGRYNSLKVKYPADYAMSVKAYNMIEDSATKSKSKKKTIVEERITPDGRTIVLYSDGSKGIK